MAITAENLDREFALLESAAANGERCPQSIPHGPLNSAVTGALARAGRIRIEIFAHNWRVVTLMDGPHKGKQTMPTPHKGSRRPYKIIGKETVLDTQVTRRLKEISLPRIAVLEKTDDSQ